MNGVYKPTNITGGHHPVGPTSGQRLPHWCADLGILGSEKMGVTGGSRVNHGGFSMVCLEGSSLPGVESVECGV